MIRKLLFLACAALALGACQQPPAAALQESPEHKAQRMEWFSHAKLGIFIHWGIYSAGRNSESWCMFNGLIPYEEYMKQMSEFTADKYDPAEWAELIKQSGARYTVITTKHHDGFALWDTRAGDVSAVKSSAAGRDVIAPFVDEVRKQGLRLGFYYSLVDWPREDYPNYLREGPARYDIHAEPERWQHFLDFNKAQLEELTAAWHPDLIWFDGDWEFSADEWRAPEVVAELRKTVPDVVINSRIQGYGDYATPEQGVPVVRPESQWWETCMTMNDSWGYRTEDDNYKTPHTLLCMLADCISKGGNFLLDIGPRADGTIPAEQVAILKEFGRWTSKHAEAIYDTRAGIPAGHVPAYTALNEAGDVLYLYLPYRPTETVEIKGLKNAIKRARVVGRENGDLEWIRYNDIPWSEVPGVYYLNIPEKLLDEQITVVAIELEEPVKVYRGSGQILSMNEY